MVPTFLGIVERFNIGKSGPAARLRPMFQSSSDKTKWSTPEEEFPNSGVVSWWQAAPDADIYRAWTFQTEPSWTYEHDKEHHDFYGVKGSPSPAFELIDLISAEDPEDTRSLLLEEGISLERCATKRLSFRDRSGSIVGPIELTLRDGRLFLDERETLIPVNVAGGDLNVASWEKHQFLPLDLWPRKAGEVDYSSNSVFLKRILREIREITPQVIDSAKLTERLIGTYCTAVERMSMSSLQQQRLKRLHKLAAKSTAGVVLSEDAIPDLLSLPAVRDKISVASEEAARSAIEERRATLDELDSRRASLERENANLKTQAAHLSEVVGSLRTEQGALLSGFDKQLEEKFKTIGEDTSAFLTDIAVIRAALSIPAHTQDVPVIDAFRIRTGTEGTLGSSEIASSLSERFQSAGLGCVPAATLLSSWASGYVPLAFGVAAHDLFAVAGTSLFGGRVHTATLGPSATSPTDLLRLPTSSSLGLITVGELLIEAKHSSELFLLIFDNLNLCQLDSTLVPIMRAYVSNHVERLRSRASVSYATPAGLWSSNVLLGGILVDSPLALPMSRELWTFSAFVSVGIGRACAPGNDDCTDESSVPSGVSFSAWVEWLEGIEQPGVSDTRLLAGYVARKMETSRTSKNLLKRLAAALDLATAGKIETKTGGLLAEMAVVPYLISRGIDPDVVLKDSPVDLTLEEGFIDRTTRLFEKWGLELF